MVFTLSVLGISNVPTRWSGENFTVHSTEFLAIGRVASEEVILISPACCERLRHCHSILRNLNHSRILLSAFCSKCLTLGGSADIVTQFQEFFNFPDVSKLIFRRKRKLNNRFTIMKNLLCNTVNFKFQTVD